MSNPSDPYGRLAARVAALPPSCGPVRVVAVDGRAGAGKTSFAARLGAALGARAEVLHTDDLLDGWADHTNYWPRLAGVLDALAAGRSGRYRRYDWLEARFAEPHVVPPVPVLVVEGVTSAAATAGRRAFAVWVEAPREVRLARGLARDGEGVRAHWERWMQEEDAFFAAHPPAADLVVDGVTGLAPSSGP